MLTGQPGEPSAWPIIDSLLDFVSAGSPYPRAETQIRLTREIGQDQQLLEVAAAGGPVTGGITTGKAQLRRKCLSGASQTILPLGDSAADRSHVLGPFGCVEGRGPTPIGAQCRALFLRRFKVASAVMTSTW